MKKKTLLAIATAGVFAVPTLTIVAQQDDEPPEMGFFVTSVGLGDGGNLGGLAGADAHCNALAAAAGSSRTWAAYLSTQGPGAVNARDRIGDGPWANANGLIMATSVESLHYDNSNFNWTYSLDENGNQWASRIDGDPDFTVHDVLTARHFLAIRTEPVTTGPAMTKAVPMLAMLIVIPSQLPVPPGILPMELRAVLRLTWYRLVALACFTALPLIRPM